MTPGKAPPPGSVIRYAYLWADEEAAGREEGQKDRPAVVLVAAVRVADGDTRMLVLAVTHTPPRQPEDAVPFPAVEKRSLGLDDAHAWIVTTEGNAFEWPGPDIRPIPARTPHSFIYGQISPALLQRVARSYLSNRDRQRARIVGRTE